MTPEFLIAGIDKRACKLNETIKTEPLVSVIINCHNSAQFLHEALNSVYAQTFTDWEIILWDNASTDDTSKIASSYDQKLRYFKSEEFSSLGKARNLALKKTRSKYISFLDSDDIWLPDKLEKQVSILNKNADIAFVYSNYFRYFSNKTKKLAFRKRQPEGYVFDRFLYDYPVGILTAIVRKQSLMQLEEVFDENLSCSEEFDVFMRVLFRSKAAYINEPLALYRIHSQMHSCKLIDKYQAEIDYTVNKFKNLDPLFERKYDLAIKFLKSKMSYIHARTKFSEGKFNETRQILSSCVWKNIKYPLLYICAFLCGTLYRRGYNCRNSRKSKVN